MFGRTVRTPAAVVRDAERRRGDWLIAELAAASTEEYCQWERFNASCPGGADDSAVILMTSGRYGRMRFGRCMRDDGDACTSPPCRVVPFTVPTPAMSNETKPPRSST